MSQRKPVICLEGNISAGKSTMARDLASITGYKVFLEPTIRNPFLEDFYKDPKTFALPMQIWLLRQRFHTYVAAMKHIIENDEGAILDRSVFSDYVFAYKNYIDGNISEEGFQFYVDLRNKMLNVLPSPHIVLYLDTKPQTCYKRVHGLRGRDCEAGIPLEYLTGLDEVYQDFLRMMEDSGCTVIKKDWNNFGNVLDVAKEVEGVGLFRDGWTKTLNQLKDLAYEKTKLSKYLEEGLVVPSSAHDGFVLDVDEEGDNAVTEEEEEASRTVLKKTDLDTSTSSSSSASSDSSAELEWEKTRTASPVKC